MPRKEPRNKNRLGHKDTTPVQDYLQALYFRNNRLWKQVGARLLTFVNGEWLSDTEFQELYPVPKEGNLFRNQKY